MRREEMLAQAPGVGVVDVIDQATHAGVEFVRQHAGAAVENYAGQPQHVRIIVQVGRLLGGWIRQTAGRSAVSGREAEDFS
jgi:hypothetical protein